MQFRTKTTFYAAVSLAIFSLCLAFVNTYLSVRQIPEDKLRSYSYLGDDFPEFYVPANGELKSVMMTMEESRHYAVTGPDALDEWASGTPVGYGYVRLGPESRGFSLAMFHELHCLHVMRLPLDGKASAHTLGHMQHCLNYLRQFILCSPNLTLEPVDVLTREFEENRVGATHVCRDWTQMYEEMENNWREWEPVRHKFNQGNTSPSSGPL